jgi:sugar/nucleoside kinase (ribokinase family)
VIVVIGSARLRGKGAEATADGLGALVAVAAVRGGARVELISKIGDDAIGDELSLALARAGIGHVATLRDAAHATVHLAAEDAEDGVTDVAEPSIDPADIPIDGDADEPTLDPADVELALRYLSDYRVIVVARPAEVAIIHAAATAANWANAHLVVALAPGMDSSAGLPADALIITADEDDGGALAGLLGAYAAAIDGGTPLAQAFDAFRAAATT